MNTYENMASFMHFSGAAAQKSIIFLHPEQIQLFSPLKKGKSGENTRIRMAESIRKYGVLQPFSVRIWQKESGFSCYQLVGEEERFRAVCMAGVDRIPCIVLSGEDKQCAELTLLNEYRQKKMHFLDEARFFERLTQEYAMRQTEIAEKCGLSQSSVANKMRLLQLSDREQESIRRAGLGERHARAILRIFDPKLREKALETVILRHLSVVQTEELADKILSAKPDDTGECAPSAEVASQQQDYSFSSSSFPQSAPAFPGKNNIPGASVYYPRHEEYSPVQVGGKGSCLDVPGNSEGKQEREGFMHSAASKSFAYSPFNGSFRQESARFHDFSAPSPGVEPAKPSSGTVPNGDLASRRVTAKIPAPAGILPRKFILHDLQPLYNSIEKTLSIFRKTGMNAECTREEAEDAVRIYIKIPRKTVTQ